MTEYHFEHAPRVAAGRVVFRLHNAGTRTHELVLVALPDDFRPIDEQLRSEDREGVETVVVVRDRQPGNTDTFASDLQPGRYAFICFVTDPDGVQHALKGMSSEFRVTE
jgi:hypothetical protein